MPLLISRAVLSKATETPPPVKGGGMRARLGLIPVGIVVALALAFTSAGAQATGGGRIAAACSNETVTGVTLRFVLHGSSCNKAHSLIRAYFRRVATPGYCLNRGTACSSSFAGGWDCATHVAGEHDGVAGCGHYLAPFATFTVYRVTRPTKAAKGCSNETVTVLEAKPIAVDLRFVLHGVSCTKAHSLIRTYFRHQATPGYCLNRGNICAFVGGGWTCSHPLYAGEGGGDFAGCVREAPFASVKVYTVTGRASTAAEPSSLSIADELTGVAATSAAAKRSCGTERVQPGTIGAPKTGSTSGPGIPYMIIVWRGKVSCRKARSLIKATGEGKGTWHEAPDIAAIYTNLPGGWSCALATGGNYGCVRGRRVAASGHADEIDGIQL